jgi:hypothetical protein
MLIAPGKRLSVSRNRQIRIPVEVRTDHNHMCRDKGFGASHLECFPRKTEPTINTGGRGWQMISSFGGNRVRTASCARCVRARGQKNRQNLGDIKRFRGIEMSTAISRGGSVKARLVNSKICSAKGCGAPQSVLLRRNAFETGGEDRIITGPRIEPKAKGRSKAEAMSAENPQFLR